jgi:nucleotide-binding universal stress UspA family protein
MNTILLATDGSPSAARATDVAIELAGALGATLHIVTAWRMPVYEYGYVPVPYVPELLEEQRKSAAEALEHAVVPARAAGVEVTSELREGVAADEICAAAQETAADMIVLGAHGWGTAKRLLFGSVSSAVLHHAAAPVLVVRGEPDGEARDVVGAGAAGARR